MKTPSLGDLVLTSVDPTVNNGAHIAPAFITRVWAEDMVNIKVILDGHEALWKTSVALHQSAPEVTPPHHHYAWYPSPVPYVAPPLPSSMGGRAAAALRASEAQAARDAGLDADPHSGHSVPSSMEGHASPEVQAIADAHSHPHRSVDEYLDAHPNASRNLSGLINGAHSETT